MFYNINIHCIIFTQFTQLCEVVTTQSSHNLYVSHTVTLKFRDITSKNPHGSHGLNSTGFIQEKPSKITWVDTLPWLVIECDDEIMPTHSITKFDDDPLNKIKVTERTRLILDNSRAITLKCFMGSGWLLDLAKRVC